MNTNTYRIILTGEVLNDADPSSAHAAFAKLFKVSTAQAQQQFAKAPTVIKSNADESTAKKFQLALRKANIGVKVQKINNTADAAQAQQTASEPPAPTSSNLKDSAPQQKHSDSASMVECENKGGYPYKIEGRPDYAFLSVQLAADETIKIEASSMATMDTHIKMKTKMKGGFGRLLTGENLFINEFTAENAPGEVGIAPGTPGDVLHQPLQENEHLFLRNSAYLASSPSVEIQTKLDIFKGIFSGAGLVLIKCSGPGDLFFNTYGAAIKVDIDGEYVVDTDKIIAWTENLEYKITKVGGYKSLFFSGEGFVCRFSGKGTLWIQTRSAKALTSWAHWYRPGKS